MAVHTYGNVPLILSVLILLLLVLYLSLFFGTFTILSRLIQQRFGFRIIILTPFFWVGLGISPILPVDRLSLGNLGHSQYLNLPFIQMADITGVYGLSFVILLVNIVTLSRPSPVA